MLHLIVIGFPAFHIPPPKKKIISESISLRFYTNMYTNQLYALDIELYLKYKL